jgi:hypothetical protein
MKLTVEQLRDIIKSMVLTETRKKKDMSASPEYMQKELVRQDLQSMIMAKISSGEISDQAQLTAWFDTATMALSALKMVPIEALKGASRKKM